MEGILTGLVIVGIIVSVLRKANKVSSHQMRADAMRKRFEEEMEAEEVLVKEEEKPSIRVNFEPVKTEIKPAKPAKRTIISAKDLRRAVVMNEVLGKPVSMRDK